MGREAHAAGGRSCHPWERLRGLVIAVVTVSTRLSARVVAADGGASRAAATSGRATRA